MDYHIHTYYSADCNENMEDIIRYAVENNIDEICFTDHIDYDSTEGNLDFDFNIKKYFFEIENLSKKYRNIRIKKGIELGIQPHILERCNKLINEHKFDFVLASMHGCNREDFYLGDFFIGKSEYEAIKIYLKELKYMIENFNNYSVIGHIDILKRYNLKVAEFNIKEFEKEFIEIFKLLVKHGKGIEVNSSGLRQSVNEQFPSEYLLKLYKECGGEIITIGSDSHIKETLEKDFDKVKNIIKNIGFNYIYSFDGMKPIPVKI